MLKKPNSKKDKAKKKRSMSKKLWDWGYEVAEFFNFKCAACGGWQYDFPHHILFRKTYPEYKYEDWNGILFCRECHDKIHKGLGLRSKTTGNQWMIGILEKLSDGHRCKRALKILKLKEK